LGYDVIIAGAGPVGLFLACELRLRQLSVLVLEQLEDPRSPLKRLPFGMRGLWGPSIEAFYRRGLLDQIAAQPRADDKAAGPPRPGSMAPGSQRRGPAGHFAGIQFDYSNIDSSRWTYRLPGPADTQLGSEMEHLERVLSAHALSVGVEIERGHGVEGFEASNDEITVRIGRTSGGLSDNPGFRQRLTLDLPGPAGPCRGPSLGIHAVWQRRPRSVVHR
jgi:2-polyprenyl-6-methoxyphenol hydroxylase-like FAD-dependent oxidoreductase